MLYQCNSKRNHFVLKSRSSVFASFPFPFLFVSYNQSRQRADNVSNYKRGELCIGTHSTYSYRFVILLINSEYTFRCYLLMIFIQEMRDKKLSSRLPSVLKCRVKGHSSLTAYVQTLNFTLVNPTKCDRVCQFDAYQTSVFFGAI